MNEPSEQFWTPTHSPIEDDRVYHRSDDRLVKAVFAPGATVQGFYGLRRFGKTSFLRKVERACLDPRLAGQPCDAVFVSVQNKPGDLNRALSELLDQLDAGRSQRRTVVLLDDLEFLDQCYGNAGHEELVLAQRLTKTITNIFKRARGSGGQIRIVLCEPTNFQDWLNGEIATAGGPAVGAELREAIPESQANLFTTLPILNDIEAACVLYGAPPDAPPAFDESFVRSVNLALGGNPWFLAIAAELMRENPANDWQNKSVDLMAAVDKAAQERNRTGMRSMYEALSSPEKLIVNILYEGQEGSRAAREKVSALFERHNGDPWTRAEGASVARRLVELGLASDSKGSRLATELTSEIFSEVVKRTHSRSVVERPTDKELVLWDRLCKSRHPTKDPLKPTIIHQFGDLFFEDGKSASWSSYIRWLDTVSSDERPHLIVICGNLIDGFPTEGKRNQIYAEAVSRSLEELERVLPYLQPAGEEDRSRQLIIVPGVLDLDWTHPDELDTYRQIWDRKVEQLAFSTSGDVHRFNQINVNVLAFDSVRLDEFDLGERAAREVAQIRQWVNSNFREQWPRVKEGQDPPSGLVRYTLEYTVTVDPRGPIDLDKFTETFVWNEQEKKSEYRKLLSEAGYVATRDVEELTQKLQKVQKRKGSVSIAVTHHYPRQRRRSMVTEFLNPFRFRQALVKADVPIILHGHSPMQQCLFEGTPHTKGLEDERSGARSMDRQDWARAMYLVGSGSFSSKGNLLLEDELTGKIRHKNSTFNEIQITRRVKPDPVAGWESDADMYDVRVGFFELAGTPQKQSEFSFPVAGSYR